MNLGFRTHYPWNPSMETRFRQKIELGIKKHTVRENKYHRWVPGKLIHFCTGIRTKAYHCFKMGYVTGTQKILIDYIPLYPGDKGTVRIKIDGRILTVAETDEFVRNDGFDSVEDFARWFNKDFFGDLIHWTDKRY